MTVIKNIMKLFVGAFLLALVAFAIIFGRNYFLFNSPESVTISSANVELAAVVSLPDGEGPYPAVVFLHGSGPEVEAQITSRTMMKNYNRLGYAVIAFDKRGAGASTGEFQEATMADFQADAIAVVDYVFSRSDIDHDRVGLHTVSESSWYGPAVARARPEISFLVQNVGTVFDRRTTIGYEVMHDAIADGIAPDDAPKFRELAQRRWDYYAAVAADPSLDGGPLLGALDALHHQIYETVPGAQNVLTESPRTYSVEAYQNFAVGYAFDPAPDLLALNIPVLFLLGAEDKNISTFDVGAQIQQWQSEGATNISYYIFADVGHSLATPAGWWNAGFVPGYFDELSKWLATH